jgi:hypothetical protein
VGLWLEQINLGSYRQAFEENGVNGEYLEGMSMFTTEQILRFIRRCHMKWGDFITLCKELRRIKGLILCLLLSYLFSNTVFSWKQLDIPYPEYFALLEYGNNLIRFICPARVHVRILIMSGLMPSNVFHQLLA